jgi:hypothetical protein
VVVVRKSTRLTCHTLYKIMKRSARASLLERVQQVARHVSNLDDELFPCEDANLCEVCQRITLEELSTGFAHHNFAGLVKSLSKGCKICTLLKLAHLQTKCTYLDISNLVQAKCHIIKWGLTVLGLYKDNGKLWSQREHASWVLNLQ